MKLYTQVINKSTTNLYNAYLAISCSRRVDSMTEHIDLLLNQETEFCKNSLAISEVLDNYSEATGHDGISIKLKRISELLNFFNVSYTVTEYHR
jgi:hypothetical protein